MKKCVLLLTIFFIFSCWKIYASNSSDYQYEGDLITGYNFLFSTDNNPYYRSHTDLSEGLFADGYFNIITEKGNKWFDQIEIQACIGRKVDLSNSILITVKKRKLYSLKINYNSFYDFFYDPLYNYGANNRNLERNSFNANFNWFGVKHFIFNFGYKHIVSKGNICQPSYNWGEIFAIPLDMHETREEFRTGAKFYSGGFLISFDQSWIDISDNSRYRKGILHGIGFGSQTILSTDRNRSGSVDASIPVSTIIIRYKGNRWSTSSTFSYKNGSLDEDLINLMDFLFYDFNSRNSFLIHTLGGADTPQYIANYNLEADVCDYMTVEYNLEWNKTETSSNLNTDQKLTLFPIQGNPIDIHSTEIDGYYYKNTYTRNSVSAIIYPAKNLTFTTSYYHTSGDITQRYIHDEEQQSNIYETYTLDKLEFITRYRTILKTELKGGYSYEKIDNPIYRTAGDHKNEFFLSASQPLNEKTSIALNYHDSRLKDSSIHLDSSVKLFEGSIDYTLSSNLCTGFGFTHLDLNHLEDFIYFRGENQISSLEDYDTSQNGYFVYSTFKDSQNRFKGQIQLYYLDDNGESLPLSHWNVSGNIEAKLLHHLWVQIEGRYYDYKEDIFTLHNYSFDQFIFALHWKF